MHRRFLPITLAVVLGGCVPSQYMGVATGGPISDSERKLLEFEKNSGQEDSGKCYGVLANGEFGSVPCELVPLKTLARLASLNNQHAQLELGKRYEAGRGVRRDYDRAEKLYIEARKNRGGPIWIYVPGVGDAPGRVQQVDTPVMPGLREADERLRELRKRRLASEKLL